MDPTTVGFITQILNNFITVFSTGFGIITPRAQAVLGTLAALEIALAALFWAVRGEDFTAPFLRKLLRIGFFTFLVASWPTLTNGVVDGLSTIGAMAGGGDASMVRDPSRILDQALIVIQPIDEEVQRLGEDGWMGVIASFAVILQYTIASLLILLAFAILAITCFITVVEFYLVAVLGLIFVPWGISSHTSFLAEKAIGAVIAQGVKLMVLSFVIAVYAGVLATFTIPPAPSLPTTWMMVISAFIMTVLAVHAPAVAGGLLSGSPSLTAGSAAGVAIGAGAVALGGAAAAGMAGSALGRAGAAGASKTIAAAGQIHGAGSQALAAHQAAGGGGAAAGLLKAAGANPQVRGAVAGAALQATSTQTGKAVAAGVEKAATSKAGQAALKGAAAVDRGATAAAKAGGAGLKEAGKIATKPLSDAANKIKETWSKGKDAASNAPSPTSSPQQQERMADAQKKFSGATAARTANAATRGLTTTQSGGSGNPTIRPSNDES